MLHFRSNKLKKTRNIILHIVKWDRNSPYELTWNIFDTLQTNSDELEYERVIKICQYLLHEYLRIFNSGLCLQASLAYIAQCLLCFRNLCSRSLRHLILRQDGAIRCTMSLPWNVLLLLGCEAYKLVSWLPFCTTPSRTLTWGPRITRLPRPVCLPHVAPKISLNIFQSAHQPKGNLKMHLASSHWEESIGDVVFLKSCLCKDSLHNIPWPSYHIIENNLIEIRWEQ